MKKLLLICLMFAASSAASQAQTPPGNALDFDGSNRIIWLNGRESRLITIYPNPADDTIHLNLDEALLNSHVLVYDASGRLVQKIRITNSPQQLNIKTLPGGVYLIQFSNGSVARFVKQ